MPDTTTDYARGCRAGIEAAVNAVSPALSALPGDKATLWDANDAVKKAIRALAPAAPEPTEEMVTAALNSKARDDEGDFPSLSDLLDFSGENKARSVAREAIRAALAAGRV